MNWCLGSLLEMRLLNSWCEWLCRYGVMIEIMCMFIWCSFLWIVFWLLYLCGCIMY